MGRRAAIEDLHLSDLTQRDVDGYTAVLEAEAEMAAQALVDALPESQGEVVRKRILEHHEYAEIARELGLTESRARQQVARGLAKIRARIGRTVR